MKMSMGKINDWCTSFRIKKKIKFRSLYTKLEGLCLEEFNFLYVNNKTKLTKKLFLRSVCLFFTLLFFFLMIAVYFYGMSILLKNEIHATWSAKYIETYSVIINLGIFVLFMFGAFSFIWLCSVVRDIKDLEIEVLVMEMIDRNRKSLNEGLKIIR
uniref:hypothetical protein n=2 Tax=Enterococcus faecalis TaxID=1351 RepID=UPI00359C3EFD